MQCASELVGSNLLKKKVSRTSVTLVRISNCVVYILNPYLLDLNPVSELGDKCHASKNMQCFITAVMGPVRQKEMKQSGHILIVNGENCGVLCSTE
jgi:hypothetical protein